MHTSQEADRLIGGNVAKWRAAAGLTQAQLASRLRERGHGFQQQTVMKVEKGDRPLRLREALDVAAILDVDLAELVQEPDLPLVRKERELIEHMQKLGVEWAWVMATHHGLVRMALEREATGGEVPDQTRELVAMSPDDLLQEATRVPELRDPRELLEKLRAEFEPRPEQASDIGDNPREYEFVEEPTETSEEESADG